MRSKKVANFFYRSGVIVVRSVIKKDPHDLVAAVTPRTVQQVSLSCPFPEHLAEIQKHLRLVVTALFSRPLSSFRRVTLSQPSLTYTTSRSDIWLCDHSAILRRGRCLGGSSLWGSSSIHGRRVPVTLTTWKPKRSDPRLTPVGN